MGARQDLRAALQAYLVAVTSAMDGKVIFAGAKGPRPELPYLALRVQSPNARNLGPAERVNGLNGSTPQASMRARREAAVDVQGYGTTAGEWLDELSAGVDSPASLAAQAAAGLAILVDAPPADISAILDTAEEPRFVMALRVRYQWLTAAADQVELLTAEVTADLERYDGDADTLNADTTVTL